MSNNDNGDRAAIFYLCTLLLAAIVVIIFNSASADRHFNSDQNKHKYATRNDCNAKLRSFGYQASSQYGRDPYEDKQKRRDDVCLQIRAAEAAEGAAEYARLQYMLGWGNAALVFIAAVAACAAACFTYQQAIAARRSVFHARRSATAGWKAVEHAAQMNEIAKADQRAWLDVNARASGFIVYPKHIRLTTVWRIKNIGRSPAREVSEHVTVIPVGGNVMPVLDRARVYFTECIATASVADHQFSTVILPDGEFGVPGMISDFQIEIPDMVTEDIASLAVIYCATYRSDGAKDVKVSGAVAFLNLTGPFMPPAIAHVDYIEFPGAQLQRSELSAGKQHT